MAITGARYSVQVLNTCHLETRGGHVDTETLVMGGQRLVGHSGAVTSVAWSRSTDWLITGGADQVNNYFKDVCQLGEGKNLIYTTYTTQQSKVVIYSEFFTTET